MMKHFNIIFLIALSLSMAQCSSEDEPATPRPDWNVAPEDFANSNPGWTAAQEASANAPQWAVDFSGNDAAPSWTDPDKSVYPTSMTAVVRLVPALEHFAADADQMAAFIGNECRGVAQAVTVDGVKLFFIQVKAPSNESGNVEFRYFSSHSGRIYKSAASDVPYVINKVYGTADAPAYPNFLQSGKYSCIAKAYVTIAPDALPHKAAQTDEIAAIVGDECRSIAYANADGSNDHGYLPFHVSGGNIGYSEGADIKINASLKPDGSIDVWPSAGALSDFNGKRNTESVGSAAKKYPAGYNAKNFNNGGITSWYLPSAGEMALMYALHRSGVIAKQEGFVGLKEFGYWTSTECSEQKVWVLQAFDGKLYANFKTSAYMVRPSLAF